MSAKITATQPIGNAVQAGLPLEDMAWIPGGMFLMGSEDFYPEERPVHRVSVDGFWMDEHAVTNAEFRRFVKATGYVTVAERPLDPSQYPDADPKLLVPGALVFRKTRGPVNLNDYHNWWEYVPGACWTRPEGLPIYIIIATGPITALTSTYAQFRESSGAGRRLFELLDTPPGIEDAPGAEELPPRIRGEVEFNDVNFRYGEGPQVLHDLSLQIEAGKVVALVGASGAGKTTMASLIPRFYDVEAGAVLVDGRDVKAVTLSSLRAQMAIVPQDPQLFGGSVRDNITYARSA